MLLRVNSGKREFLAIEVNGEVVRELTPSRQYSLPALELVESDTITIRCTKVTDHDHTSQDAPDVSPIAAPEE